MYDARYWREEAETLREYAERTQEPSRHAELLDLAKACEEVAERIEDRAQP